MYNVWLSSDHTKRPAFYIRNYRIWESVINWNRDHTYVWICSVETAMYHWLQHITRLSMTICSAWYVVPLFTASRIERVAISGYCFSIDTFCGTWYWNWKLRPKVRNFFGRSTGIPIPTTNWRELEKMFIKRNIARNHVCAFHKVVGKQTSTYLHRAVYF